LIILKYKNNFKNYIYIVGDFIRKDTESFQNKINIISKLTLQY